jgi:hypothetical protein
MSLQDDHFDLESHFEKQVNSTREGTSARQKAESVRDAYNRIWGSFVDIENENEKLRPVVNAVSTLVRYVVDTHYVK